MSETIENFMWMSKRLSRLTGHMMHEHKLSPVESRWVYPEVRLPPKAFLKLKESYVLAIRDLGVQVTLESETELVVNGVRYCSSKTLRD